MKTTEKLSTKLLLLILVVQLVSAAEHDNNIGLRSTIKQVVCWTGVILIAGYTASKFLGATPVGVLQCNLCASLVSQPSQVVAINSTCAAIRDGAGFTLFPREHTGSISISTEHGPYAELIKQLIPDQQAVPNIKIISRTGEHGYVLIYK